MEVPGTVAFAPKAAYAEGNKEAAMRLLRTLAAVLLPLIPAVALAGSAAGRLEGTWIETEQIKDYPRTVLHFKGDTVRFENMYDKAATVRYKVEKEKDGSFTVSFEYRYKVKQGNGRIVERREMPEFLYHVENGRPILSQKEFEYDGRGPILLGEFLREEDFVDGFRSELKHMMNDRPAPPMTMMRE